MRKKDLFNYLKKPTIKEFRKKDCIDDFYGIPKLNIPKYFLFSSSKDYLINDSIVNYNNEVIVVKTYYSFVKIHLNLYKETGDEYYEFWARKFIEQTIKQMYSIYDKSIHIINYIYDLQVEPNIDFKKNVKEKLKQLDHKFYLKIKSVYSRLYGNKYMNLIRDDITHNMSQLFFRYIPIYRKDGKTSWRTEEEMKIKQALNIIKEISELLEEQYNMIIEKLKEFYPKKGTKEYYEKLKIKRIELNKKLGR